MSACVVVTESDMLRAGTINVYTVTRIGAAEIGRCVHVYVYVCLHGCVYTTCMSLVVCTST